MDITTTSSFLVSFLTNFVSDFLVILLFLGILTGLVIWKGRSAVVALTLSILVVLLLYIQLPFEIPSIGNPLQDFLSHAALFFAAVILIDYFMSSFVAIEGWPYGIMRIAVPTILVLSCTVLILAVLFQVLDLSTVYTASPYISALFTPPEYFFWWIVGPLLAMIFFSRA